MAGDSKRRAGPFSMVYAPWAEAWARAGLSGREHDVMLALCERLEFDGEGGAASWYPRAELSERLGCSAGAVTRAVKRLRARGFLNVKSKAHRGASTVYEVMPAVPWPANGGTDYAHQTVNGGSNRAHQSGIEGSTDSYHQTANGGTNRAPMVGAIRTTPKKKEWDGLLGAVPNEGLGHVTLKSNAEAEEWERRFENGEL